MNCLDNWKMFLFTGAKEGFPGQGSRILPIRPGEGPEGAQIVEDANETNPLITPGLFWNGKSCLIDGLTAPALWGDNQ